MFYGSFYCSAAHEATQQWDADSTAAEATMNDLSL